MIMIIMSIVQNQNAWNAPNVSIFAPNYDFGPNYVSCVFIDAKECKGNKTKVYCVPCNTYHHKRSKLCKNMRAAAPEASEEIIPTSLSSEDDLAMDV